MSHRAPAPAPASAGRRLITGPKDATPAGGWNWMIGVRYRIKASASPVVLADSRIGRSVFEPLSQFCWQACLGEDGTRKVRVPRYLPSAWPESLAVSNRRAPTAAYCGPTESRLCWALVQAATRGSFSPAA